MWIWPFQRVGSVVFVFCTKFGSNICYSHWDRRTFSLLCFQPSFDDVTRINFRFWLLVTWSSPRCRGASFDIIWCQISLPSPKLLTFFRISRWRPPPSWIFSLCEFGDSRVLVVWYLCSVPNLVQISVIVTEIDTHICFRPSFDDVTRINFRFRLLVTWASPRRRHASSDIIWCKISLFCPKLLTFFRNSRWRPPPSWIFSLCEFGHSSVLVVWYVCSVPNLVQISVIVTEIDAHMLPTFIWWRHAN